MPDNGARPQYSNSGVALFQCLRATTVCVVALALSRALNLNIQPEIVCGFRVDNIRHCVADISKVRQLLGAESRVRFEEGLRDLVSWIKEQSAVDRMEGARVDLEARGLIRA